MTGCLRVFKHGPPEIKTRLPCTPNPLANIIEHLCYNKCPTPKTPKRGSAPFRTATEAPKCSMTKKANKATRYQQPRRSPKPAPGSPAGPDTPDVSGNDREIEISRLSPRQQAVLPVVALSPSIAQAARDSGVSERTLRRWLDDTAFREQLSQLHQESYDLARKQLQALVPHLISVLAAEAIENPDPLVRIRAARYAMNYAVRFCEVDKLADDVRDLRGALLNGL